MPGTRKRQSSSLPLEQVKAAQEVLRAAGLYAGEADGIVGKMTAAAVELSERKSGAMVDKRWSMSRRLVAAMQRELSKMGHLSGEVDGDYGPKTASAFYRFNDSKDDHESPAPPSEAGEDDQGLNIVKPSFTVPRRHIHAEMVRAYGEPGDKNKRNTAGVVNLPFPFIIAWDKSKRVSRFFAHEKAAPVFESIFKNAARHFGEDEYRRLGLDLFGGCYNGRLMRGSKTSWSTHAWGVAVDLDPEHNQLRWGKGRARFANEAYLPFWKIVEAHDCVSLGRARDYDWMHFQLAKEP